MFSAVPLGLLVRLLLVVGLVIGATPPAATTADPAFAWARLAGALCLADEPAGMPVDHHHDHCLACQGSMSASGLVAKFTLPAPVSEGQRPGFASVSVVGKVGWAAYASRAPPLSAA